MSLACGGIALEVPSRVPPISSEPLRYAFLWERQRPALPPAELALRNGWRLGPGTSGLRDRVATLVGGWGECTCAYLKS